MPCRTSSRFDCFCRLALIVDAPASLVGPGIGESGAARDTEEELVYEGIFDGPFGVLLTVPMDAMADHATKSIVVGCSRGASGVFGC